MILVAVAILSGCAVAAIILARPIWRLCHLHRTKRTPRANNNKIATQHVCLYRRDSDPPDTLLFTPRRK